MRDNKVHIWRKQIIDTLYSIQEKYPTDKLEIEGVYYWPIVKIRLFFTAYKTKVGSGQSLKCASRTKEKEGKIGKVLKLLRRAWQYLYLHYLPKKKIKYLTSGAWSHRIEHKGKWVNRYFVNLRGERVHIEYTDFDSFNIDLKEDSYELNELGAFYQRFFSKSNKLKVELEENKVLLEIVNEFNFELGMNISVDIFNRQLEEVIHWSDFWTKMLNKTKPEEVRMLCYYTNSMYGLCVAGNRLSIPVVDMQHGGQGALHVGYNGFGALPKGGYNSVPSHFSVWDTPSKVDLDNAGIVNSEKIIVEGNPWIEFHRQELIKANNVSQEVDILYTLQTTVAVPEFMYQVIEETSNQYKWVLKTHPRMTKKELEIINNRLQRLIEEKKVVIDEGSGLLELLIASKVHTSGFSGSIQEAYQLQVPSIITDPIGYDTYKRQMETEPDYHKFADGKNKFILMLDDLIKLHSETDES